MSRLVGDGDDSAVIFVYARKEQDDAEMEAFVKAAEPAIMNALDRTRAVSYTHLDVYKRQADDYVRQIGSLLQSPERAKAMGQALSLIHI